MEQGCCQDELQVEDQLVVALAGTLVDLVAEALVVALVRKSLLLL